MIDLFKCEYCDRIFTADEVEIYDVSYGRITKKYRGCPYCRNDEFYETTFPYKNCDAYGRCDFDCDNCNVKRAENNPVCKNQEDCCYDCENCPLKVE